jgi:hypothetical protein
MYHQKSFIILQRCINLIQYDGNTKMSDDNQAVKHASVKKLLQLTLLGWISMIGVDFLLHGGLFASIYIQKSPFLLSPIESFRRIPLGFLALLVFSGFLVWILRQSGVKGWLRGLGAGAFIGALVGASLALGLYSISTASIQIMVAWFAGQVFEMGVAGAVIGQGFAKDNVRGLSLAVVFGVIILFSVVIIMQSVGLAPSSVIR